MNINFTIEKRQFPEEIEKFWDGFFITAYLDNNPVGYISISYISQEKKEKFLKSPSDFFIYHLYSYNSKLHTYYENNDIIGIKSCIGFKADSMQEFHLKINQTYQKKYDEFVSYWVNKASTERVRVYDENDDFHTAPTERIPRKQINYQRQGIATELYYKAATICKENNILFYSSKTQTDEGKKLWSFLEKNSRFIVLSEKYNNIERKKISVP